MNIKPGMYFDTRTGEEVEIIAINKDSGMVSMFYHKDGSYNVESYELVREKFIALDDITAAAEVLFSDDE